MRPPTALALWPSPPAGEAEPWLEPFFVETDAPRPAVLVLPGGGYRRLMTEKEGSRVAARFAAAGWHAFVLHYRVAPSRFPAPLHDAWRALALVRERAAAWRVDPGRVAACGFSAGAHLAGAAGILAGSPSDAARPDALILGYPVVSALDIATEHGSFEALLGPSATAEALAAVSLERHVDARTPPTFLWHTAEDAVVPVENSLRLAAALSRHAVPFELHVYPRGVHGMGLADRAPRLDPHVATWSGLAIEWLRGLGF
ncbi:MAG: alpha/beta hydrolase [Sandaracinaceae bacterium]|nr:alpha/beta hydrolase [Sandaracinaceae bacterium]